MADVRRPAPAAPGRGAHGGRREQSPSAGDGPRITLVAGSVVAVAVLGVATGLATQSGERLPVLVAAAVLLAATGVALLAVRRGYRRPAARSARILTEMAGSNGRLDPPLEAAAGDAGGPAPALEAAAAAARSRLSRLEHANQRLNAVIGALPQGVLVFGHDGTLREINRTGAGMLNSAAGANGTPAEEAPMTLTSEILKRHGVTEVAEPALYHGERADAERRISGRESRWLRAQSQPFTSSDGERGALVVLHDVTRLRHLEQMRSDFVANVSHELRTPITSISGFVETLLDSEMYNSAQARHFLEIVVKHSSRLEAILDDLMSLANIELGEERRSISFGDTALDPVISAAVQSCGQAAVEGGVALQAECDPDLTCRMNPQLVEQAVTNLLDNAIKHSDRDARVVVRAARNAGDVLIEVTDTGIGIAPEHQQRIFERFYRVDRARSRENGGTGLGLAIVKHIAQAHDGDVSVRSTLRHGSTFTLRLPGQRH